MKKTLIILGVVIVVIVMCVSSLSGSYNSMVTMDEDVLKSWSNVENQYQRRYDLIPNLVNTVKGYAKHEQETLQGVMEARAKATQITVDPAKLTPESLKAYQQAQGDITNALGRLLMVSEKYPELKANQNFLELQAQLEGTENRIAVERGRFNETVQTYNTAIRSFPKSILASIFGFEKKGYFEALAAAQEAPKVEF